LLQLVFVKPTALMAPDPLFLDLNAEETLFCCVAFALRVALHLVLAAIMRTPAAIIVVPRACLTVRVRHRASWL
jgi:hypothetical protein